ncbi:MAG: ABC transporter permease [Candidatus Bipolaricaulia bacterium]
MISGLVLTGAVILMSLVSFFYTPHSITKIDIAGRFEPPNRVHLLGTDEYGRDTLSRIMVGSQTSLLVGIVAVGIAFVLGTLLGVLAGMAGAWVDEVIMRWMDILYAFPAVVLAILLVSVIGPGILSGMVAIGIASTPGFARLARSGVLSIREEEYVQAAYAIGRSRWTAAWRHIVPNMASTVVVQATIAFAGALLSEAGLSYLGLGVQPPIPSWGRMLKEAQTYMGIDAWLAIFPGVAIALFVLGLYLLGDGIRQITDPRLIGTGD